MDTLNEALELAQAAYKKEFGKDAKLEDGEEFATVFNDGILIMGLEDKTLKIKLLCGKPYIIDFDLNLTEEPIQP